jgi:hypothetical protein
MRREMAHHDFAIDEIFGATEADETDFHDRGNVRRLTSILPRGE